MSKYKTGNMRTPPPQSSGDDNAGSSISSETVFIGSVMAASGRREDDQFYGADVVQVTPVSGIKAAGQGAPQSHVVSPLNPYFRSVPLPGEQVLVIKGEDSKYYYSDVINTRGKIGDNIQVKGASILPDATDFFTGLFAKPRPAKKMDPTEGDVIVEGRAGQTIRLTSTSEESFLGKLFGGKSENKPVIMITCHTDEEEGLGNEDIVGDDNSIYLCSETPLVTLKLESSLDKDYEQVDRYGGNQIIMRSDRLILSSRKDSVLISSGDKVGISTKKWKVDIDKLMDIIEGMSNELKALTSATATFNTGVGPTFPATNASKVVKITSDVAKLKQ